MVQVKQLLKIEKSSRDGSAKRQTRVLYYRDNHDQYNHLVHPYAGFSCQIMILLPVSESPIATAIGDSDTGVCG